MKFTFRHVLLITCYLLHNTQLLSEPNIRIVCSAALIPSSYHERERQYIHSLSLFKQHGLSVYMVESCQKGPTRLDEYCDNICYTQTQIPRHTHGQGNWGINEALALKKGLEVFAFDDEDIIVKFTGKYEFKTTEFLDLITQNPDADVIARIWRPGDAYSLLFAIRMKYFKEFLNTFIDFDLMESHNIAFEHYLGAYIQKLEQEGKKIVKWQKVYDYLPTAVGIRN